MTLPKFFTATVFLTAVMTTRAFSGHPPRIHDPPDPNKVVPEGGRLKLKCPIQGKHYFDVEWSKDGERITSSTWVDFSIQGKNGQILRIRRMNPDYAGDYTCKGVNGYGAEQFVFKVAMQGEEDDLHLIPGNLTSTVVTGERLRLTCQVENPGGMDMRWLKRVDPTDSIVARSPAVATVVELEGENYRHLKSRPGSRLRLSHRLPSGPNQFGYTLTIDNVTEADEGEYVCLVINSLVKLDKQLRFNKGFVKVLKMEELSSSSDWDELKILLVVLPCVAAILIIVLLCLVCRRSRGQERSDRSTDPTAGVPEAKLLVQPGAVEKAVTPTTTIRSDSSHESVPPVTSLPVDRVAPDSLPVDQNNYVVAPYSNVLAQYPGTSRVYRTPGPDFRFDRTENNNDHRYRNHYGEEPRVTKYSSYHKPRPKTYRAVKSVPWRKSVSDSGSVFTDCSIPPAPPPSLM